jgi:hypothetical protein
LNKNSLALICGIVLTSFFSFASCASIPEQATTLAPVQTDYRENFELYLYTDKQTYTQSDKIHIWSTLQYTGSEDSIQIWHSIPYIVFKITDGKEFTICTPTQDYRKTTILKKNQLYTFEYVKSGAYDNDSPSAPFWRSFFAEKDLHLPAGEYTITVQGNFSVSQDLLESNNLCVDQKITVTR